MAGLSSRFFKSGYNQPKYMLKAHGKFLFDYSLESFSKYFKSEEFLFIVRDVFDSKDFVVKQAYSLGIKNINIVELGEETRGQAETVAIAIKDTCYNGKITIFNIDTFRSNFTFPVFNNKIDGYLEVFEGSGSNWSFAKPYSNDSTLVQETAEKKAISNLCSTGLYFFSSSKSYLEAFNAQEALPSNDWCNGELYIAPLYNYLIGRGEGIHYHKIERGDVTFLGTPEEYQKFIANRK